MGPNTIAELRSFAAMLSDRDLTDRLEGERYSFKAVVSLRYSHGLECIDALVLIEVGRPQGEQIAIATSDLKFVEALQNQDIVTHDTDRDSLVIEGDGPSIGDDYVLTIFHEIDCPPQR